MTAIILLAAGFGACCAYMVVEELLTLGWGAAKWVARIVRMYWTGGL